MTIPQTRSRITQEGASPVGSTPAQFQKFQRDEIQRWTRIIEQAGIKPD